MKGLLFKEDMHKAIREGRKTITRRVIKFHTEDGQRIYKYHFPHPDGGFTFTDAPFDKNLLSVMQKVDKHGFMPRYQVGETVYVKETHYCYGYWIWFAKRWRFRASKRIRFLDNPPEEVLKNSEKEKVGWFKRPALFLPADCARTFLKITDVRPERLQEITPEDCEAEGIITSFLPDDADFTQQSIYEIELIDRYKKLWDTINPKYPYSSNPYVWRIEFILTEREASNR